METNAIHRGSWRCLPYIAATLMCAYGFLISGAFSAQVKQVVRPSDRMLRASASNGVPFKSWSLFLVCNPQWLSSEKAADLHDLYLSFGYFGETIGDDNLSVWFSKSANSTSAEPDLEVSSRYCRQWSLQPSRGPYLVVTTTYPGDIPTQVVPGKLPPDNALFELGNMKPSEIHGLLSHLTDQLLLGDRVAAQAGKQSPGLFVGLLEAVQHVMNDFGCAWTFQVDTGPVKANLQPCHKG